MNIVREYICFQLREQIQIQMCILFKFIVQNKSDMNAIYHIIILSFTHYYRTVLVLNTAVPGKKY